MAIDTKDERRLKEFLDELETIRDELQRSSVLSKASNKYEQNLKKLIDATKNIVNGASSKKDTKEFEKLVRKTDMSLKVLQKNNKNDEKFQKEFKGVFGDIKQTQDFSNSVLKKLSTNLSELTKSVGVLNSQSSRDVGSTASDFFTGPFGKIISQSVDLSKAKSYVGSKFSRGGISGQAHNGMTNIPSEGTYMLDGGERVLSQKQNEDLSSFLGRMEGSGGSAANDSSDTLLNIERNTSRLGAGPLKVFNAGHDSRYFDSIIENDDRIYAEETNRDKKQHKEVKTKFEILGDILSRLGMNWLQNQIVAMNVWFKRFQRMPILTTLSTLASLSGKMLGFLGNLSGIKGVFGKLTGFLFGKEAKNDTDRIVQSNYDVERAVRNEAAIDRRGFFRKIKDSMIGGIKNFGSSIISSGFQKLNKRLPQARDEKGRFKKRDKTGIIIDNINDMAETLNSILLVNNEMLEEAEEGGKGGGMMSMLGGKLKGAGGFAGGILKSIGVALAGVAKGAGKTIFRLAAKTVLGKLGLAFAAGGLIGTYIINPIIDWLDGTFKFKIGETIGKMVTHLVSFMENLPGVGWLVRKATGGAATRTLEMQERNERVNRNFAATGGATTGAGFAGQAAAQAVDRTQISTTRVTERVVNTAQQAAQQAASVVNNTVNNNQQVVKPKPAVDDVLAGSAALGVQ